MQHKVCTKMYPVCTVNLLTRCLFITGLLVGSTHSGDVKPQKETQLPDYSVYHNVSHIQLALLRLTNRAPGYIQLISSFRSREGRPQLLLRITNFTNSQLGTLYDMKAKILLSYGEHAREFFPIESLIHLLSNLTDGLEPSASKVAKEFSHAILSNIDLFIVAMMNPDGRCYIERTGNHCWRGTSTGVDLNRNFDWYFGRRGSSADSKDEEYRGPRAFSEPECNILINLTARFSFDAFVSLHSGIRQIYVPFADSVSKQTRHKPGNLNAMLDIAQKMSHATSKKFTYGIAYHLNDYTADGTIFDYMAGVRKIPFSFAIELWGEVRKHARCFDLFNPTNENLQLREISVVHAHQVHTSLGHPPSPYHVSQVYHHEMMKLSGSYVTSIRPGKRAGDPTVHNLSALEYLSSGQIRYKLDFSEKSDWEALSQRISIPREPFEWVRLLTAPQSISLRKFNDLQSMNPINATVCSFLV